MDNSSLFFGSISLKLCRRLSRYCLEICPADANCCYKRLQFPNSIFRKNSQDSCQHRKHRGMRIKLNWKNCFILLLSFKHQTILPASVGLSHLEYETKKLAEVVWKKTGWGKPTKVKEGDCRGLLRSVIKNSKPKKSKQMVHRFTYKNAIRDTLGWRFLTCRG